MQIDIRLPIGLLFSFFGLVITIFGFATQGSEIYKHSLNININIYTGICLVIFGMLMLFFSVKVKKGAREKKI